MDIDPKTPICGVRPAVLKQLLRRPEVTLSAAMAALGQSRPDAQATLAALQSDGWLEASGASWTASEKGQRLTAARLLPRIPVEAGKEIVRRLLIEVEAINADATHLYSVETLILFGSILTAGPGDTLGDVDLGVRLRVRPEAEEMWSAELATAPSSFRGIMVHTWPSERVMRRLRKISRSLSLHSADDALRFPHAVIYKRQPQGSGDQPS
jgi:hypothetical protein